MVLRHFQTVAGFTASIGGTVDTADSHQPVGARGSAGCETRGCYLISCSGDITIRPAGNSSEMQLDYASAIWSYDLMVK